MFGLICMSEGFVCNVLKKIKVFVAVECLEMTVIKAYS